jgi:hypothetical protein
MSSITFDTLAFVKELQAAGFSNVQAEAQAKAFANALKQMEDSRLSELASKRDLKELEVKIKELEVKINEAKIETIKWVAGMLIVQAGILISGFFTIVKFLLANDPNVCFGKPCIRGTRIWVSLI